jgi:hypothetical protein
LKKIEPQQKEITYDKLPFNVSQFDTEKTDQSDKENGSNIK